MSDAAHTLSREEEMLARLAELGLAAAEKAHGKLMAAEDAAEIAEMSRAYQRMSRSLRQTLALKARLAGQREALAAKTPAPNAATPPAHNAHLTPAHRVHIDRAAAEVMAFVERETEPTDFEHLGETEIYEILVELARDEDFLDTPVQHLLDRVFEFLGQAPDDFYEIADPADRATDAPTIQDSA